MRPPLMIAAVALALAAGAASAVPRDAPAVIAQPAPGDEKLLLLQELDARLLAVGYRLAVSAGDLCPQVPLAGFVVHDISQYPGGEQAAARATFGFGAGGAPLVLAVAPGSAAERAGLEPGDALETIDGAPPAPGSGARSSSYARTAALIGQIDAAVADGALTLGVSHGGEHRVLDIALDRGCASRFEVSAEDGFQSKADGTYVQISTDTIFYADSEEELAVVVAHELSHNILRHRERLDAAGIKRGLPQMFGRNARLTRRTEDEADRLAVYLLDRAGYPTSAIASFWERFRRDKGAGIFRIATHSSERQRIAMSEREIARIAKMKAAGQSPRPDFMEGPELPELR
ncbi:M48 family metalloprotease [Sphingomonas canadensis]|uniref:M48 family metalloprotease n=1 Tax=Sphingomonas canadensis TaxID=1219257 RepID=A0ABW3H5W0_9SPHN|nr:M48 family metallopeptidase [Sphingomonas canadensis]MCW3835483.1 M48 family metallopeptidase [Sphingomonas canadensis]